MPSRILAPTGGPVRAALVGALILCAGPARAGDHYYVIIFGSQSTPKLPRYTHTWATFIRACDDDGDVRQSPLQVDTISWLAADMEVRALRLRAEPGRNFDLETTLHFTFATRQRVSEWGPYEISPEFYEQAMRQKARLESGEVKYKAIDPTWISQSIPSHQPAARGAVKMARRASSVDGWRRGSILMAVLLA